MSNGFTQDFSGLTLNSAQTEVLNFALQSGITWVRINAQGGCSANGGLMEVEVYGLV